MSHRVLTRLPKAFNYAGQLFQPDGGINHRVDARLCAGAFYAEIRESDYFLKVWFDPAGETYYAEVWSCQRWQETYCGAIEEIVEMAAGNWGNDR